MCPQGIGQVSGRDNVAAVTEDNGVENIEMNELSTD